LLLKVKSRALTRVTRSIPARLARVSDIRIRGRWRQAGLFILLLLLAGCTRPADPAKLLPTEASGWLKTGEARSFDAGELWRYVDGAAEKYVAAGVRRTATADYRYRDRIEAVAEIHQFAAPTGAQTIMDSEAAAGSQPVQIGDAARLFAQTLVFRRGPYLVRIVAYQESPENGAALSSLAQAIAAKL